MNYQSNKPYPIPKVERKNKEYARLLLEDYAGANSEDTAIHSYLYQYLLKKEELKEFSNIMEHIAEVEMHHLSLLGETIKLLGIVPAFGSYSNLDNFIFWNSSNVCYNADLKKIILCDIKNEEEAIRNYKKHYAIIKDHYVRELINRIIEDEEVHIFVLNNLYQKYFRK